LMFSTNRAGVFLFALAPFLIIGIVHAWRHRHASLNLVLLLGFVTSPVAALIVSEEHAIFRALVVLPFGVLLATMGVHAMWVARVEHPVRAIYRPAGLFALAGGAAYGVWMLVKQGRVTSSTLPLL